MKVNVEGKIRSGKLKKIWFYTIKKFYKRAVGVCVGDVENQNEWRLGGQYGWSIPNSKEKGEGKEEENRNKKYVKLKTMKNRMIHNKIYTYI